MSLCVPRALMEGVLDELCELRGQIDWWKDEPRCGYKKRHELLCEEIAKVESILKDKTHMDEPTHPPPTELALIAAQFMGNSPVSMSTALMEAYAIWLAAKDFLDARKEKPK